MTWNPRGQLVVVSCYNTFKNLAHEPKGTEAKHSLYTFLLDPDDGQMVLLAMCKDPVNNPAFTRVHPKMNILYTCTESVTENGHVVCWEVQPNGCLRQLFTCDAGGTSTCYMTVDRNCKHMLVVNYWDATIHVLGLDSDTGAVLSEMRSICDPNAGRKMHAKSDTHVNHSLNDAAAQKERQSDPHSHALVLDPDFGRIAFVPDLGMDVIRQFLYDDETGTLTPLGCVPSGPAGRSALGPRYIEFHPALPVCYVVNELSSEVCVFKFDRNVASAILDLGPAAASQASALELVQTISTIPAAFSKDLNTCGRVAVHPGGNFVLCSNRGHNSIVVFRVHQGRGGLLSTACVRHTEGATPRHFQFDASGQWMITANQDSNNIAVFQFNMATGSLRCTKHKYFVPSPNFVCAVQMHDKIPEVEPVPESLVTYRSSRL